MVVLKKYIVKHYVVGLMAIVTNTSLMLFNNMGFVLKIDR